MIIKNNRFEYLLLIIAKLHLIPISNASFETILRPSSEIYDLNHRALLLPENLPFLDNELICKEDADCFESNPCISTYCDKITRKCTSEIAPEESEKKCRTFGDATIIALRVMANDTQTTVSAKELSNYLFGIMGEETNLKSQLSACSYDRFNIFPASGNGVENGVAEIVLNYELSGRPAGDVVNQVLAKANEQFGPLESQYNFTILCLPPGTMIGTSETWKAYARINSFLSVYNDEQCKYLSVLMHELGHNLFLSHSNDGKNYGDETGAMGISYAKIGSPAKCYNARQSWRLGWYFDSHVTLDLNSITNSLNYHKIVGISDYKSRGDAATIVKLINNKDGQDYYITFNRAAGINFETQEGRDKVLLSRSNAGLGYEDSFLLARLNDGQKYYIFKPDDYNVIEVAADIHLDVSPPYATVLVRKTIPSLDLVPIVKSISSLCLDIPLINLCSQCGAQASVKITTNDSPQYLVWNIKNLQTNIVTISSDYYKEKDKTYESRTCLAYGKYEFSLSYAKEGLSSPLQYEFKVGNYVLDSDSLTEENQADTFFTVCDTDEACNDFDGCTINYCDQEIKLCKNTRVTNDECVNCSWLTLTLSTDNYPSETKWTLHHLDNNQIADVIISGDPDPIYYEGFGRRKAPTRMGRRKADTRTETIHRNLRAKSSERSRSSTLSSTTSFSEAIVEKICLEKSNAYIFTITDSFGDGICCSEGNGNYDIQIEDHLIRRGGSFGKSDSLYFSLTECETDADCIDTNPCSIDICQSSLSTCVYKEMPCSDCGSMISISITTDWSPLETSWEVTSMISNNVIISGGKYDSSCSTYEVNECLPFGSYKFAFSDLLGNGLDKLSCPSAGYTIVVDDEVIEKGGELFLNTESHYFDI